MISYSLYIHTYTLSLSFVPSIHPPIHLFIPTTNSFISILAFVTTISNCCSSFHTFQDNTVSNNQKTFILTLIHSSRCDVLLLLLLTSRLDAAMCSEVERTTGRLLPLTTPMKTSTPKSQSLMTAVMEKLFTPHPGADQPP